MQFEILLVETINMEKHFCIETLQFINFLFASQLEYHVCHKILTLLCLLYIKQI